MKNIISNFNQKVKCPICHSYYIYKLGKDSKSSNQKYRCNSCKHQSTFLDPVNYKSKKGYPIFPIGSTATYLHHDYKFYSNYSCKNCNHSVSIIKPNCIDNISSNLLGKTTLNVCVFLFLLLCKFLCFFMFAILLLEKFLDFFILLLTLKYLMLLSVNGLNVLSLSFNKSIFLIFLSLTLILMNGILMKLLSKLMT